MKQKDIALYVVIGVVSLVVALFLSNVLLGGSKAKEQSAEVVEPISAVFAQPDTDYFNSESINPTEVIRIGGNDNQTPFNQATQQ